jgi:hypothetical protein
LKQAKSSLRLFRIASGRPDAVNEIQLMINEKIDASVEAGAILISGCRAAVRLLCCRQREVTGSFLRVRPPPAIFVKATGLD